MSIIPDTKTILRLTGRTAFFLLAWLLVLFTLFLFGNYQQFLDHNQHLIMTLLSVTLILEIASCLLYLLLLAFIRDKTYHPGRGRVIILALALGFSVILFVILEFFYAWMLS
jgi:glucan phosphoethanolaminetransferase (alkaline phosphatase superfamily)